MIANRRTSLSAWVADRLSANRLTFSREEAMRESGIGHGAFLDAAERLQRRQHLVCPRRGFYVIVPPQFVSWGAPPPSWYIDDLMRFERCAYYVGLFKAGEFHGATHQAVMEFQVVAGKRLPRLRVGRSLVAFHYRKDIAPVLQGVTRRNTQTGTMNVSSPELTALDLLRRRYLAVGADSVATALADMGGKIDGDELAVLSGSFEKPVAQRLGYLLERLGFADQAAPLNAALSRRDPGWVELSPFKAIFTDIMPAPLERNRKWHVVTRHALEPDW
ncbi:MAG: hypothetical protein OXC38_02070 [Gammaproteobacteria bacterium]|nr:hypothetical protein [Gammaproteobacteria bacterium]